MKKGRFAELQRVLARIGKETRHAEGWYAPDAMHAASVSLPDSSVKRWIMTTRPAWLASVFDSQRRTPARTAVVARSTLPTPAYLTLFRHLFNIFPAPISFVGDLDPYDLSIFLLLKLFDPKIEIEWKGLGDAWFEAMRVRWSDSRVESIRIAMSKFERDFLGRICEVGISVHDVVGPRAAELMFGGFKIELEGATNPGVFEKRCLRGLVPLLSS